MRELAVKTALYGTLSAWPAFSGANTTWGLASETDDLRTENIHVSNARSESDWSALGRGHRHEQVTVEVVVQVIREGDDQRATEERMWALAAEVENALAADPTLGGVVRGHPRPASVTSLKQNNSIAGDRWVSDVTLEVTADMSK